MKKSSQTAFLGLLSIFLVVVSLIITWFFFNVNGSDEIPSRLMFYFFQFILGLIFIPIMLWGTYRAYLEQRPEIAHRAWWCECKTTSKEEVTPRYHYGLSIMFHLICFGSFYVDSINFSTGSPLTLVDILILALWGGSLVCILVGIYIYEETPTLRKQLMISDFCPKCGQKNPKKLKFCNNCGESLLISSNHSFNTAVIVDK
ncbi:MAG: hypothetical protein ACFFC6_11800 [Promethearchaeota archaeon]